MKLPLELMKYVGNDGSGKQMLLSEAIVRDCAEVARNSMAAIPHYAAAGDACSRHILARYELGQKP